jgi:hypothetical protein
MHQQLGKDNIAVALFLTTISGLSTGVGGIIGR